MSVGFMVKPIVFLTGLATGIYLLNPYGKRNRHLILIVDINNSNC